MPPVSVSRKEACSDENTPQCSKDAGRYVHAELYGACSNSNERSCVDVASYRIVKAADPRPSRDHVAADEFRCDQQQVIRYSRNA